MNVTHPNSLFFSDVRPYPLPVNKIDLNENANPANFKPLSPGERLELDSLHLNYDEDRFEHIGGGVIAKKPDPIKKDSFEIQLQPNKKHEQENSSMTLEQSHEANYTLANVRDEDDNNDADVNVKKIATDASTNLGDIFQDLLELDEASEALNLNKTDDNKLESRVAPEDSLEDLSSDENILTTTERLNFMNMKDFIVQMQKNKSDEDENKSIPQSSSFEVISDSMRTTEKPTTTFVEVETLKYTPPAVTIPNSLSSQPQLFPQLSKWEFVNGTQVNITELNLTKKVFNETLQALIVENSQTASPHASNFDDLKVNRTVDKANLQQLSSIFDTLAAKLGIKTIDAASKMPPFAQQNKMKNNSNANRTRTSSTTKKPKISSTTPISRLSTTTKLSKTKASSTRVPTTRPTTVRFTTKETPTRVHNFYESSSESMIGQAEVEPVDPTKYDEIFSLMSSSPFTRFTSTTPSLVTLLPVKSNSGIRNFNPRLKLASRADGQMETVVKASMSFDS